MNTPNKLTIARIIATPFFMAALMIDFPFHYTAALILFVAAAVIAGSVRCAAVWSFLEVLLL